MFPQGVHSPPMSQEYVMPDLEIIVGSYLQPRGVFSRLIAQTYGTLGLVQVKKYFTRSEK